MKSRPRRTFSSFRVSSAIEVSFDVGPPHVSPDIGNLTIGGIGWSQNKQSGAFLHTSPLAILGEGKGTEFGLKDGRQRLDLLFKMLNLVIVAIQQRLSPNRPSASLTVRRIYL